jgi:cytochrome oxidase assembly protein ShyY1
VRTAGIIAAFALRESLRRRVFLVVGLLTLAFLALYALGTWQLYDSVGNWRCSPRCSSARSSRCS